MANGSDALLDPMNEYRLNIKVKSSSSPDHTEWSWSFSGLNAHLKVSSNCCSMQIARSPAQLMFYHNRHRPLGCLLHSAEPVAKRVVDICPILLE